MEVKTYTIDRDLEIIKNPIIDQDRHFKLLRHLMGFEIRQIKEYQRKFGNDAVLKFRFTHHKFKHGRRLFL
jgi:hypothetical protein